MADAAGRSHNEPFEAAHAPPSQGALIGCLAPRRSTCQICSPPYVSIDVASKAFKIRFFSQHDFITTGRKFQVYTQVVQAILWHGGESRVYFPAQVAYMDSLHDAIRQILQVESLYPAFTSSVNPTWSSLVSWISWSFLVLVLSLGIFSLGAPLLKFHPIP